MIVRKDDVLGQAIIVSFLLMIFTWLVLEGLALLFVFQKLHIHID